eukprot:1590955-Amphidinium_carterae.1
MYAHVKAYSRTTETHTCCTGRRTKDPSHSLMWWFLRVQDRTDSAHTQFIWTTGQIGTGKGKLFEIFCCLTDRHQVQTAICSTCIVRCVHSLRSQSHTSTRRQAQCTSDDACDMLWDKSGTTFVKAMDLTSMQNIPSHV